LQVAAELKKTWMDLTRGSSSEGIAKDNWNLSSLFKSPTRSNSQSSQGSHLPSPEFVRIRDPSKSILNRGESQETRQIDFSISNYPSKSRLSAEHKRPISFAKLLEAQKTELVASAPAEIDVAKCSSSASPMGNTSSLEKMALGASAPAEFYQNPGPSPSKSSRVSIDNERIEMSSESEQDKPLSPIDSNSVSPVKIPIRNRSPYKPRIPMERIYRNMFPNLYQSSESAAHADDVIIIVPKEIEVIDLT
jgi:hypothetical protein